jgi:carbon-monoxide dehydrogenase medium subunit
MKPTRFHYHAPATIADVLDLLAELGDDTAILAGGQSLVPMMNLRLVQPAHVVDVNRVVELDYVRRENGALALGATARALAAERSMEVAAAAPILVEALGHVAYPSVRARSTIGGAVAHADPAAELPCVLLAADATVLLRSRRGARELAVGEFLLGPYLTAREPDELLVEVRVPIVAEARAGFSEFARKAGDFALALAAVRLRVEGGRCQDARVAVGGVGPVPVRCPQAEEVLVGSSLAPGDLADAAAIAARAVEPRDDAHASGAYRRRLVQVQVRRALERAVGAGEELVP